MKICHVITRMVVGGAQENTLLSIRGLREAGHETALVTGPSPGPEGELLKRQEIPAGTRLVECPHLIRAISPWNDFRAYLFLKNFFRVNSFDVVHTHSSKAGVIGRLAARSAGVPVVVHTIHGLAFHPLETPWKNSLYKTAERFSAKQCDWIFAVAQTMIDRSLAAGIGKKKMYSVVYSGMELEPFLTSKRDPELRAILGIPGNAPVIGTVARLSPQKGYEALMKIAPGLVKRHPSLHFLFVGDGILRETLQRQAEKSGIANHISFAGLVRPDEVHRYIAQMDVLAHFSLREGLPRAAVQALASGKPVVAHPLDGTPEVVLEGITGFLRKVNDFDAMTDALSLLLENAAMRAKMGAAGQALVQDRFDWRTMSNALIRTYEELLQSKKNPSCAHK